MQTMDVNKPTAVGLLEMLWHFTARFAPQADIGKWSDEAIAEHLGWAGNPTELVTGLTTAGWLDPCTEKRLVVHDWSDHADAGCKRYLQAKGLPIFRASGSRIGPRPPESAQTSLHTGPETGVDTGQTTGSSSGLDLPSPSPSPSPEPSPSPSPAPDSRGRLGEGGLDPEDWMLWWNGIRHWTTPPLPELRALSAGRLQSLKARLSDWPQLREEIERELRFPQAQHAVGVFLTFPWLIKERENLDKFLEGHYRDRGSPTLPASGHRKAIAEWYGPPGQKGKGAIE